MSPIAVTMTVSRGETVFTATMVITRGVVFTASRAIAWGSVISRCDPHRLEHDHVMVNSTATMTITIMSS